MIIRILFLSLRKKSQLVCCQEIARRYSVFSNEIRDAIYRGRIVSFGDCDAVRVIDGQCDYVAPGLIDVNLHCDSTTNGEGTLFWTAQFLLFLCPHRAKSVKNGQSFSRSVQVCFPEGKRYRHSQ